MNLHSKLTSVSDKRFGFALKQLLIQAAETLFCITGHNAHDSVVEGERIFYSKITPIFYIIILRQFRSLYLHFLQSNTSMRN